MWSDYNVQKTARRCAATGRALAPGEEFFSVLAPPETDPEGDAVERRDYSPEAWDGPPATAVGWWRARVADASTKPRLAPNEVMLDLFDRWADEPHRVESRYVLTLLLIRRRVLRLSDAAPNGVAAPDTPTQEVLTVTCAERDATYAVPVASPDAQRIQQIQAELHQLLYDGAPAAAAQPETTTHDANNQAA